METIERKGSDVLLDVLRSEGVTHIFGNPGTTELPLIDALAGATDIHYMLGLQEATVVGMADGYAQATGRPAVISLHSAAGLGNALGNLTNALANGTPLVVTAGQQDYRHLFREPLLGWDLVSLATGATKSTQEVRTLGELGTILRRAFHSAASPPTGPVFVSLPSSILEEVGEAFVPPPSHIDLKPVAGSLEELASLLSATSPDRLALVVGDEVVSSGAVDAVIAVAETLGVRVFGSPLHSNRVFPPIHPLWAGALLLTAADVRNALKSFERVFLIGGQAFKSYLYSPGPALPETTELLHLSPDPLQLGRTYPTRLGLWGDPKATLEALLPLLKVRVGEEAREALARAQAAREAALLEQEQKARALYSRSPLHPLAAVHAILRAVPQETIIVDEAVTTGSYVRTLQYVVERGQYYFAQGGGLGWGMPASLGISLGSGRRPVVCLVGDGSAMYSPQALWTAAHENLPVLFVVINNSGYRILKDGLRRMGGTAARTETWIGMDLIGPGIDFVALARSLGVDATLVEQTSEIGNVVQAALKSGKSYLMEVPIAAQ